MTSNYRAECGCGLTNRPADLVSYQIPLLRTKTVDGWCPFYKAHLASAEGSRWSASTMR